MRLCCLGRSIIHQVLCIEVSRLCVTRAEHLYPLSVYAAWCRIYAGSFTLRLTVSLPLFFILFLFGLVWTLSYRVFL